MKIAVDYARADECYDAYIVTSNIDTPARTLSGVPFKDIIGALHEMLNAADQPCNSIEFSRREAPNVKPMRLPDSLIDLVKTDPVTAIRALTPSPVTVVVKDEDEQDTEPDELSFSSIQVGHDTIADSFGDYIYARCRNHKVECVACGRWVPVQETTFVVNCNECSISLSGEIVGTDWWRTKAHDALNLDKSKFYISRPWNTLGPWISKIELQELIDSFEKEKRECLEQMDE